MKKGSRLKSKFLRDYKSNENKTKIKKKSLKLIESKKKKRLYYNIISIRILYKYFISFVSSFH